MSEILFYKNKPLFGLEINSTAIKAMAINNKMVVTSYGLRDVDPLKMNNEVEDEEGYITEQLNQLLTEDIIGSLGTKHVVVGIPTAKTFSRTFTFPRKIEKNLKDAINLEVEQYIPLPRESLYIDFQIIERTKTDIIILLNASPKKYVDTIYQSVAAAGLLPVLIEPNINAIARVLRKTEKGDLSTIIVDIGAANTDIAILDGGMVRVTGGVAVGGNTLTLNISKNMNVSLENAYQLKVLNGIASSNRQKTIKKAVLPVLETITNEIRRVMRYYADRVDPDVKFEQLLIVGNGANMPGLGDYMTNELYIAARVAAPWEKLNFEKLKPPTKQVKPQLIAVSGLACLPPKDVTF